MAVHPKRIEHPMNRTTSRLPTLIIASAVTLAVLLTGCASEPDEPELDPQADADAEQVEVVAEIGPAECLIGTWQVDNASFEAFLVANGGGMAVSGGDFMRFDDAGAYFSWSEDFTFSTGSGASAVTHVSNSSYTGDYGTVLNWGGEFPNDFLWVAETMIVVQDEVFTVGGIAQFIDDGGAEGTIHLFDGYTGQVPFPEEREAVEGTGPFWCDIETLKLATDIDYDVLYHRVG
jgi:hypothetical protein